MTRIIEKLDAAHHAAEELIDEMVRRKFLVAEALWPIRDAANPFDGASWSEFFKRVYREDLRGFRDRARKEGLREAILAVEHGGS